MDSPRPVPPYSRLVVPSACWNASKIDRRLCSSMPMPVSVTANADDVGAPAQRRVDELDVRRRAAPSAVPRRTR